MKKDNTIYCDQILDAIAKIEAFVHGVDFDSFKQNQEKQSAAILQLIIIGELSKHLSEAFKSEYDVPWKQVAGLRDRAVHDYFSLDIGQLWRTMQEDIPALKEKLQKARVGD